MFALTPGPNPLYLAQVFIDDEDGSFIEMYWLQCLDEHYPEMLTALEECMADDTPETLLLLGYSTLAESEVEEVRLHLASLGVQSCFPHELNRWMSEGL